MQCASFAQSTLLDNATHFEFGIPVNDVVYDPFRDVLYASIPSSAGLPIGNSIATIDPESGAVLSSIFVGSEPNTLAISDDASHVFVGIDGARGVRSWQPASGTLSAIQNLNTGSSDAPAVAYDIAVLPNQSSVAVVSADDFASSSNGELMLFDGSGITGLNNRFRSPDFIDFTSPTTLVGYNPGNSGLDIDIFELNGTSLNFSANVSLEDFPPSQSVNVRFDASSEVASDGLLYFSDGTLVDPSTLTSPGFFDTGLSRAEQLVEAVPDLDLAYFVGPSSSSADDVVLSAFDVDTFLEIDSITLPVLGSTAEDRGELIVAGEDRLAFVWKPQERAGPGGSGILHIVSGVPTAAVPEPSALTVLLIAGGLFVTRRKKR